MNGYTASENGDWVYGINIYQQLAEAGYLLGIVSYYGPFVINFSNGYQYIIVNLTNLWVNFNFEIISHSMGGLMTMYMLENYVLPVNLLNVITIGTPFKGSNLALVLHVIGELGINITFNGASGFTNMGYQDIEPEQNSASLNNLNEYQSNVTSNYPNAVIIAYEGKYDPWGRIYSISISEEKWFGIC